MHKKEQIRLLPRACVWWYLQRHAYMSPTEAWLASRHVTLEGQGQEEVQTSMVMVEEWDPN